jgi:hypothetical protein
MENLYNTMSLNVAAFLKCNGIEVVKVEKKDGKAVFYFPKTPQVKTLVDMYFNDVTLKRFIIAFKDIKQMAQKA